MAATSAAPPSRSIRLLDLATDALLDGRNPFDHSFLVEHRVTADECFNLAETLAIFAKAYVRASPDLRNLIVLLGASHDSGLDPRLLEASVRAEQAMRRVRRV